MAIYRLSAQVISRSEGRSVVAAAAYRSGGTLTDARTGKVQDYSRKGGVEHAEIMAPEDAPAWMREREALWNGVEAAEKRKDAQLAREIELALPRELSPEARLELTRGYVQSRFVSQGMVADVSIHNPPASDGAEQPHAHILLTMREIEGEGFGKKAREWNAKERLEEWRSSWAEAANLALERAGVGERIDHRSLEAQREEATRRAAEARERGEAEEARMHDLRAAGCDREPQPKLGPAAAAMERRGLPTARGDELRAAEARNAERRSLMQEARAWAQEMAEAVRERVESVAEQEKAEREQERVRLARDAAERAEQERQRQAEIDKARQAQKDRDYGR